MHEILDKLHRLPSIPIVVQELISSFDNPALDNQHLAAKISQDQALAAKVLRVANSSFYGLSRQIGSIQEAVVVLGFSAVRSMVLSTGLIEAFSPEKGVCVDRKQYWHHGLVTAAYAKAIGKLLHLDGEMAFSSGLLHDFGIMVLDVCDHERFSGLWHNTQGRGVNLIEAERTAFGFDHAELGAEVAHLWKFPQAIEDAIRFHYQIDSSALDPLVGVVQAAAMLAHCKEENLPEEEWFGRIPLSLRNDLKLEWEKLRACLPPSDQLEASINQVLH